MADQINLELNLATEKFKNQIAAAEARLTHMGANQNFGVKGRIPQGMLTQTRAINRYRTVLNALNRSENEQRKKEADAQKASNKDYLSQLKFRSKIAEANDKEYQAAKKLLTVQNTGFSSMLKNLAHFGRGTGVLPQLVTQMGLAALAGIIVKTIVEWSTMRATAVNSMTIITRSTGQATDAFNQFNQAAMFSGFFSGDVTAAATQMVVFGMKTKDAVGWMQTLENESALTGQDITQAANGIASMQESGVFNAGALPQGAIPAFAKAKGISNFQASIEMNALSGKVPTNVVMQQMGMQAAIDAQAQGAAAARAKTLPGILSNVANLGFGAVNSPGVTGGILGGLPFVGGILNNLNFLNIPGLANGGTSSGGPTLVGEKGPEIVSLAKGANVSPLSNKNTSSTSLNNLSRQMNTLKVQTASMGTVWNSVWYFVPSVLNLVIPKVITFLTTTWTTITTAVSTAWNLIETTITDVVNGTVTSIKDTWNNLPNIIESIWSSIGSVTSGWWNYIVSVVTSFVSSIPGTVSNFIDSIPVTISQAWSTLSSNTSDWWNYIVTTVSNFVSSIPTTVWNFISSIPTTVSQIWASLSTNVSDWWNFISSTIYNFVSPIPGNIFNLLNKAVGWLAGIWSNIQTDAANIWNGIIGTINDAINTIMSGVNWLITQLNNIHLPSLSISLPNIPGLANGGTSTMGGMALVGENGPEMLNLPTGASVAPLGHGSGSGDSSSTHIHLEGSHIYGYDDFNNMIIQALNHNVRRGRIQGLSIT